MKFLVLLISAKKQDCGIFFILMNKKKIIPISFKSWNRYEKIYENTSFIISLDKKLDNLFHYKLVSSLSFANGAIFRHPSSFLTPPKKAKLSWAYFPQDSRGSVCDIFISSWRLYWWTRWNYLFHVEVKNHRDGTRFFIPLESSFFSQLRKLPQLKSNDLQDREYTSRVIGREQKNKHVIVVRSEPPIGKTFSTLDRKSVPVLQLLIYFKALSWPLFGI